MVELGDEQFQQVLTALRSVPITTPETEAAVKVLKLAKIEGIQRQLAALAWRESLPMLLRPQAE